MAQLKIDFVSDISCPWCVIGLRSLQQALDKVGKDIEADIHLQPFELNPDMPAEGEDIAEHIGRKYGSGPEQFARNQEAIRARGAELGFTFAMGKRTRIYNTFDAHRLLHWAEIEGRQLQLKNALFAAYFTEGRDPSDHEVLVEVASNIGLDAAQARDVLESDRYAQAVREQEHFWRQNGIQAVPSVIVNNRYLIQGGQPPDMFVQALQRIAAETATSAA